MKQYLALGKIVGTHGLKGETRFDAWCDSPDFVKRFKTLYFDEFGNKSVSVQSSRPHGNIVILKLKGVDSIEEAQVLRGVTLYINRDDANLKDGWFIEDLLGSTVLDVNDGDIFYGKITDVMKNPANDVWQIEKDGNVYLIPAIKDVVKNVDAKNGIVYIEPLKGIFD